MNSSAIKSPIAATLCLILSQLSPFPAQAAIASCQPPSYVSAATPLCPIGTTMLSDDYPVQAMTISDDSGGYAFIRDVVFKTFQAQPSPAPLIFLNAHADNILKLTADLTAQPWATAQMIRNLRPVPAIAIEELGETVDFFFTWQQDIAKGAFEPSSGLMTPRMVTGYPDIGDLATSLPRALQSCGIKMGPPTPNKLGKNGFSGGNIDLMTPDVCVMGDSNVTRSEWESYSKQMCGDKVKRIKAPTSWTAATHVDEIFKAIRLPVADGSCSMLLEFASPKKAYELLHAAPTVRAFDLDDDHINGVAGLGGPREQRGLDMLCGTFQQRLRDPKGAAKHGLSADDKDEDTGERIITPFANRQYEMNDPKLDCALITNGTVADLLQSDRQVREYNQLAQQNMDAFKADVLKQLAQTSPQCHVTVLDVPQIFMGNIVVNGDAHHLQATSNGSSGFSVLPNPTNSVLIGKTLLMPEIHSATFKSYLVSALTAAGLKVQTVDTLDQHANEGDLHCATQVFRYCRPQ